MADEQQSAPGTQGKLPGSAVTTLLFASVTLYLTPALAERLACGWSAPYIEPQ